MQGVIEESLNNFLNDTEFPYTPSNSIAGGGMMQGSVPTGDLPMNDMEYNSGEMTNNQGNIDNQGQMPNKEMNSNQSSDSTTYNSAQEYIH